MCEEKCKIYTIFAITTDQDAEKLRRFLKSDDYIFEEKIFENIGNYVMYSINDETKFSYHFRENIDKYSGYFFSEFKNSFTPIFRYLFCVQGDQQYGDLVFVTEFLCTIEILKKVLIYKTDIAKYLCTKDFTLKKYKEDSHVILIRNIDDKRYTYVVSDNKKTVEFIDANSLIVIRYESEVFEYSQDINNKSIKITIKPCKIRGKITIYGAAPVHRFFTENDENVKQNVLKNFPNFSFDYNEIMGKYIEILRILEYHEKLLDDMLKN